MKVCQENGIYMVLKCNANTTGSTMELFVFFLLLSSGLSVLAGGGTKSKCCALFMHLIQVVCVVFVCLFLMLFLFFLFLLFSFFSKRRIILASS